MTGEINRSKLARWGAAHLVVATLGRMGLVSITLRPQGTVFGSAQWQLPNGVPTVTKMRNQLDLTLSGALSVGEDRTGALSQAYQVAKGIAAVNGGTAEDEMRQARHRVLHVLDQRRNTVEQLAALLVERDTLTAEEVTAALN